MLKNSIKGIFASKSSCSPSAKMRKLISSSSKILHKEFRDSLATFSQKEAFCETTPMHLRHFASASWVLHKYLTCEMSRVSVFKGQTMTIFQKLLICLFHAPLNSKHYFLKNLYQSSRAFISKTHLRYVLTLFSFESLDSRISRVGLFLKGVRKFSFSCQNFFFFDWAVFHCVCLFLCWAHMTF